MNGGDHGSSLVFANAKRRRKRVLRVFGKFALVLISSHIVLISASATLSETFADRVAGQADLAHRVLDSFDGRRLSAPLGVALDRSVSPNHLYVSDWANNRVLAWFDAAGFANAAPADLVIGQSDVYSNNSAFSNPNDLPPAGLLQGPMGLAVDSTGNLFVADAGNNRVLEFDAPFKSGLIAGQVAHLVFGQGGSFTTKACNSVGLNANSLCSPTAVALDAAGNLFVADYLNARVLEYHSPLMKTVVSGSGDTTADTVFGQFGSFATSFCDGANGLVITADTLCAPTGVALDGCGNLYVADYFDSRILQYFAPVGSDTTADRVFGQMGSFNTNYCNNSSPLVGCGPTSAEGLAGPTSVTLGPNGNLYALDLGNGRVLEYQAPFTDDTPGSRVFGQKGSMTDEFVVGLDPCNLGKTDCAAGVRTAAAADTLCYEQAPIGTIGTDAAGNLYIPDTTNNRVVRYDFPFAGDPQASAALGQPDLDHNLVNFLDGAGLYLPPAIAIDKSITPNRLYVSDTYNNRVLGWRNISAYRSGQSADVVIGSDSFFDVPTPSCPSLPGVALYNPKGIAVDSHGNLYVADSSAGILEFDSPFDSGMTSGEPYGLRIGSSDCASKTDANTICFPSGLAFDRLDNLYVADFGHGRVLEYDNPLTTDTVPDRVFGQPDFTTSDCSGPSKTSICSPREPLHKCFGYYINS